MEFASRGFHLAPYILGKGVLPMYPELHVNLSKIRHNAARLTALAAASGITLWGVTKVLNGAPLLGETLLDAGVAALGESRISNLQRLQSAGVAGQRVMLRLPSPTEADRVVSLTDISLNSELLTMQALGAAAIRQGRTHGVLLMVDLGDLREGIWPENLLLRARQAAGIAGLKLLGIGTNLTCYGGVIPTEENLRQLVGLADELESAGVMECQIVSGGNSSSVPLLLERRLPRRINNLRLGEAILLGREAVQRQPIAGLHVDAISLWAEVVEVKAKPSLPIGQIGQNAFGQIPQFEDRGVRQRAILAVGRQDVNPSGLSPLAPGVRILGASSDHLVLDVSDHPGPVSVGHVFGFHLDYGALLRASNSADVDKVFVSEAVG